MLLKSAHAKGEFNPISRIKLSLTLGSIRKSWIEKAELHHNCDMVTNFG